MMNAIVFIGGDHMNRKRFLLFAILGALFAGSGMVAVREPPHASPRPLASVLPLAAYIAVFMCAATGAVKTKCGFGRKTADGLTYLPTCGGAAATVFVIGSIIGLVYFVAKN
jgi:hypothetical protein